MTILNESTYKITVFHSTSFSFDLNEGISFLFLLGFQKGNNYISEYTQENVFLLKCNTMIDMKPIKCLCINTNLFISNFMINKYKESTILACINFNVKFGSMLEYIPNIAKKYDLFSDVIRGIDIYIYNQNNQLIETEIDFIMVLNFSI
jgi:hypothetical protein